MTRISFNSFTDEMEKIAKSRLLKELNKGTVTADEAVSAIQRAYGNLRGRIGGQHLPTEMNAKNTNRLLNIKMKRYMKQGKSMEEAYELARRKIRQQSPEEILDSGDLRSVLKMEAGKAKRLPHAERVGSHAKSVREEAVLAGITKPEVLTKGHKGARSRLPKAELKEAREAAAPLGQAHNVGSGVRSEQRIARGALGEKLKPAIEAREAASAKALEVERIRKRLIAEGHSPLDAKIFSKDPAALRRMEQRKAARRAQIQHAPHREAQAAAVKKEKERLLAEGYNPKEAEMLSRDIPEMMPGWTPKPKVVPAPAPPPPVQKPAAAPVTTPPPPVQKPAPAPVTTPAPAPVSQPAPAAPMGGAYGTPVNQGAGWGPGHTVAALGAGALTLGAGGLAAYHLLRQRQQQDQ